MFRSLFVGFFALSTIAVAPAMAQTLETESYELDMPITKVKEMERAAPVQQKEEPTPPSSEQIEPSLSVAPLGEGFVPTYGFEGAVEFNNFEPNEIPISDEKLEPTRVKTTKPSWSMLEPSRVVQKDVANKVVPKNNIQPFKRKRQVFKTAPSPKVSLGKTAVGLKKIPRLVQEPVAKNSQAVLRTAYGSRREIAAFAPETAYSLGHSQNYSGIQSPKFTPETAYGFSQVNRVSGPPVNLPKTAFSLDRNIEVTNVPTTKSPQPPPSTSTSAADLGGAMEIGKVQEQAAEVETQPAPKPEPKPNAPKVSISGGVSGIGASPKRETSLGLEYEGLSSTLNFSRPLDGTGQEEIGLDVTMPISQASKLTISTASLNVSPTISATVESKVDERLTASASFNNINKNDFNLELAANYQIDARWVVNGSFNVTTRQLNLGASYIVQEGVEASVTVDNLANTPQLGLGLTLELTPSTKLEVNARDVAGDPSLAVKVTQSFSF